MIKNSMSASTGLLNTYELAHEWVLSTHQRLIDVGCVQTEDIGQYTLAPSAGTIPSATTLGYRIYELNDTHSSEQPVYFKLVFRVTQGTATNSISFVGVYILTVGFGTDGGGNLTGFTAPTAQQLVIPNTDGGALPVNGVQARTLAVKGDDFMYLGGLLGLSYQASYNIHNSGFFGILRNKNNQGTVDPAVITIIYPNTGVSSNNSLPLRYQKLSKTEGASNINTNMHTLPRINNAAGVLCAVEADISEMSILETTDTLLALRTAPTDTPWGIYELSLDGVTSRKYLHLYTAHSTTNPTSANIPFNACVDSREPTLGALGLLWGE
ncbi:hypothetical protein [Acinetobacter entericus]|uniref:Virion structural protein n=1 Tax=Acinetobacter entericus TaxID=2989714 RepID=A0ABT3NEK1_9GAMM|nr:hypothetical protein [Acinetobacter entericus]MCW8037948.1 hypothetical protein [Acinetobacter entericus]